MVKSLIIPTEILQRPKKKNIIFEEIIISRFILISIFTPVMTPAFIFAIKMITKTIKPVR